MASLNNGADANEVLATITETRGAEPVELAENEVSEAEEAEHASEVRGDRKDEGLGEGVNEASVRNSEAAPVPEDTAAEKKLCKQVRELLEEAEERNLLCDSLPKDSKKGDAEKELKVPEYDADLNHVFFAKKSLCQADRVREEELRLKFYSTYKAFFNNRQDLINTLRDIGDEVVQVQRNCNISHIAGGSVGAAAGTAALIGTVAFPPLFLGGLVVAGLATVSNLGTSVTQFFLFRNLIQTAVQKSKYDDGLMETLEDVYGALILSNLFDVQERSPAGEIINKNLQSAKLQLGLDGAKSGAIALGVRSVGLGVVEFGSGLLRGIARGAMGIGVVIDGVTIYISASDLASGSNTKLSDAIRRAADQKEAELQQIKKRVEGSGLFEPCVKTENDFEDSLFVLSRSTMASVL